MKRRKLKKLVSEKTIRLNEWSDNAWEQVAEFFKTIAGQPVTNSLLVSVAVCEYRNYLTRRMKKANELRAKGREEEAAEVLKTLVDDEVRKSLFILER